MKNIAIIGAGPAGMMAAISAAKAGAKVTVFERNDIAGKKLLLTGNGKCNFTNIDMHGDYYSFAEDSLAEQVMERLSTMEVCEFFASIGVLFTERKGCFYPFTGQAQTIQTALVKAMEHLGVKLMTNTCIGEIVKENDEFIIHSNEQKLKFDAVILACGGKAAPKTGSDGFGFRLARGFGHTVSRTYPVLVQLVSDASDLKTIAGVRCYADVSAWVDSKKVASDYGELQITDYGLSGIPVFHLSRFLSKEVEEGKDCKVLVDFVPQINKGGIEAFADKRINNLKDYTLEEFLSGLVHGKLVKFFLKECKLENTIITEDNKDVIIELLNCMKEWQFRITGHKGFENAQVTKGGVLLEEIDGNMQSKLVKGLYFAGEMADVDADCGGYNLHWAWASGKVAGEEAAK